MADIVHSNQTFLKPSPLGLFSLGVLLLGFRLAQTKIRERQKPLSRRWNLALKH